jgi:hypothetical protein
MVAGETPMRHINSHRYPAACTEDSRDFMTSCTVARRFAVVCRVLVAPSSLNLHSLRTPFRQTIGLSAYEEEVAVSRLDQAEFKVASFCALGAICAMAVSGSAARDESPATGPPGYSSSRTGSLHDFDYFAGGWTTHQRRLKARGTGSNE